MKGDVWLVELPGSEGHEQTGSRPAITYSEPVANTLLIVPCTTNTASQRFSCTHALEPSKRNGLSAPSVALLFQLRAIDRKRLKKKIGVIEPSTMQHLDKQLKTLLAL